MLVKEAGADGLVPLDGEVTLPDWTSASVTARASQRRVEVLSERSETRRVWVHPDGHMQEEIAAAPVRFKDEADKPLRLAGITPPGQDGFTFTCANNRLGKVTRPLSATVESADRTAQLAAFVYAQPTDVSNFDLAQFDGYPLDRRASQVFAIFGPDQKISGVPAKNDAAWQRATVFLTDGEGYTIHEGSYGAEAWQWSANVYDDHDNVVQAWVRVQTDTVYDQGAPNAGINPASGQPYRLPTQVTTASMEQTDAGWVLHELLNVTLTGYDGTRAGGKTGWELGQATSTTTNAELALTGLRGDVNATVKLDGTNPAVGIDTWSDYTEYGQPTTTKTTAAGGAAGDGYGWLGAYERATLDALGITLMGARLYNQATGLFTSLDPVYGGNETTYGYPNDPINLQDLDGRRWWRRALGFGVGVASVVGLSRAALASVFHR